ALVNIARTGVISPSGELHDMNVANVALAQGAIARHRDVVVGVKARLSENVADANDLEALRRAQEAAAPFNLPVMIHIGQSFSPMRAILPLLKRGDIVTHMYAPARRTASSTKRADCSRTWQPRADAASFSISATGFSIISTGPPWSVRRSRAFGPIPSPRIGTSDRRPRASSTSPT